jgi:hypothetical protein
MISSDHGESGPGDAGEEAPVNFDEAALLELELDGTDYRFDSGRAGTALCISTRPSGSWSWTFRGEARWQSKVLRCKAFDRAVLTRLATALAEVSAGAD